jgi:hypothetical protein
MIAIREAFMGWEFRVGPVVVRPPDPVAVVQQVAEQVQQAAEAVVEAAATGNTEKLKEAVGDLILNNNLATTGARQAAEKIFPQLAPDQIERIVGSGVMTFVTTENVVLTVIAVAEQFYAEYPMATEPPPPGPPILAPAGQAARAAKTYNTECLSLTRWNKSTEVTELWASYAKDPIFVAEDGANFTWPRVDIKKGDTVYITALTNDIPDVGTGAFTVASGTGLYKFASSDTPGLGENQIIQTLVFDLQV